MRTVISQLNRVSKDADGLLTVSAATQAGEVEIQFPKKVLEDLFIAYIGHPAPSGEAELPTIPATGVTAFGAPGEPSGLTFTIAQGAWVLPLLIPESGIDILESQVRNLRLLMSKPGGSA